MRLEREEQSVADRPSAGSAEAAENRDHAAIISVVGPGG